MSKEEWRPVANHDRYEVSNLGRVRSYCAMGPRPGVRCTAPRYLRPGWTKGYAVVNLDRVTYLVHRLVLEAFVGRRPKGYDGCHNNGDSSDNRLCNLRWDTRGENCADAFRHGSVARGELVAGAKLSAEAVTQIRTHRGWLTQRHLAELFGVSQSLISYVQNSACWRHVA